MNPFIDELSRVVLKRPLQDCTIDELQRLIDEYPYFGPAQLLLAKKLAEESTDNSSDYKEQVQKASLYFQNRVWLDHLLNDSFNAAQVSNESLVTEQATVEAAIADEPTTLINESPAAELAIHEPVEDTVTTPPHEENIEQPQTLPIAATIIDDEPETAANFAPTETGENKPVDEPGLKIESLASDTDLSFQPYHTVDYFASQGIRFKEEDKPKDRFSVQLRSFTEWLKTLKRVSATEMISTGDPAADRKVEQMAEYSIAEGNVNTEAMAEVWKKQGNKAKAEEIYRKLSLLDPSKSSYFAAKIEDLKKTS